LLIVSPQLPAFGAALGLLAALTGAVTGLGLAALAERHLSRPVHLGRAARLGTCGATALLFVVVVLRFGLHPALPGFLLFVAAGVALSIVDLAEKRLPNALVLPAAVGVATLLALASLLQARPAAAIGLLAGALGLFFVYLGLALVSRGQVGMGDVKFGLVVGAATGYLGLQVWLIGLVAGVILNGIAAVLTLALRRTTLRGSVPFGPWIFAGAVLAVALAP
jgi:leader peptidase (prepilin peptidase)/N-methyltransferase